MQQLDEEEAWAGAVMAFQAYGRPLEIVLSLKYLGILLKATDNDCPEVIRNIQKAREIWARLLRILGRESAETFKSGSFYLAIVKAVLIFGAENCFVNLCIGRILVGFHHRVTLWIGGPAHTLRLFKTQRHAYLF